MEVPSNNVSQSNEGPPSSTSAKTLDIVLDHLVQGLAVIGPDYRLLASNARFAAIFQMPTESFAVGRDFRDVLRTWAACTGQSQAMLDRAIRELDSPTTFTFEFSQLINGDNRWCQLTHTPLPGGGCVRTFTDITEHKRINAELESRVDQLRQTLAEVQELRSFIPICMYCKQVRDDENYWSQIDHYLTKHAGTRFSHSVCPHCLDTRFPELDLTDETNQPPILPAP